MTMNRNSTARARDDRQLDFFGFAPVVLPADRGPPLRPAQPLHSASAPVLPVVEWLEIRLEPDPERPPAPVVSTPSRFVITDTDRLGEGSLRQKCDGNLTAIALLQRLEAEGRTATETERRTLVRYVGWGGLPQVFDRHNDEWRAQREQLESLLTPEELASARATTLNAHYTSATIIRAMYAGLKRIGFTGGRILEPACGLGHFLGLMPEGLRARSTFTGIEIDSLTVRLAKALYPEVDLRHSPFETAKLADESFDVAISNVPFGDYRPFDRRFPRFLIHDYFFAASLAGFVRAAWSSSSLHAARSTNKTASCASLSRVRRTCSGPSGSRTTPSNATRTPKSPPTSCSCGSDSQVSPARVRIGSG
jgi:hypothetical protein